MKKLFFVVSVMACSLISAQKSESRVKFGAKAGINISRMISSPEIEKIGNSRTGMYVGGFANIPLGRVVSIQPEVLYSQTGFRNANQSYLLYTQLPDGRVNSEIVQKNTKANLDYISVPVMFQFNLTREFYLEVGPQFSFLVNNKQTIKNIDKGIINNNKKFDTSGFEFGFALGTGYYFNENIGVSARYSFSAAPMVDQNNTGKIYDQNKAKATSLLQLGIIYKF
ncbi:PorT family protein [Chryseobacterium nematophagum]|uniref:PorT family protein n=1 Tax=Chryseobacterium nematophagum TaxID=2305228 RepID=A0A3M7TBT8_9FLAO|nr:porin family protein [Chryseobacterium nematophagum]RNA60983.1 PorT family protein [Chryseobacterium nematophagum]